MPCALPPELTDMIIDYIAQDRDVESLHLCSLVSRSWVPACQFHLFQAIKISSRADVPFLLNLLREQDGSLGGFGPRRRKPYLARFTKFLTIAYNPIYSIDLWKLLGKLSPVLTHVEEIKIDTRAWTTDRIVFHVLDIFRKAPVRSVQLCIKLEKRNVWCHQRYIERFLEHVARPEITSLRMDIVSAGEQFPVQAPANIAHLDGSWTNSETGTVSPI